MIAWVIPEPAGNVVEYPKAWVARFGGSIRAKTRNL